MNIGRTVQTEVYREHSRLVAVSGPSLHPAVVLVLAPFLWPLLQLRCVALDRVGARRLLLHTADTLLQRVCRAVVRKLCVVGKIKVTLRVAPYLVV